ncbi:reactive oxygen species modulator 1 [Cherax quadricarinatus]|uniref:reactive oxygen species modulator 1 n=1 Tax=Cherax quadricarinatus TaxID=27406 RepID=UPI0023786FA2|nr:reactive oxygen species modulator 1-like [Cherax quadricarinatus]
MRPHWLACKHWRWGHTRDASQTNHVKSVQTMPAVPAGNYYQQGQGPSCWDRVKLGFMMGFSVGMATGALFGGFTALRYGLRGRELMNNVGKVMLQSGGTFGTFMSIGAGIRC